MFNKEFSTLRRTPLTNYSNKYRKCKSYYRKPSPLGTLACASEDISERWTLEPAYVLNFKSG